MSENDRKLASGVVGKSMAAVAMRCYTYTVYCSMHGKYDDTKTD
jgi:hypothetical protein